MSRSRSRPSAFAARGAVAVAGTAFLALALTACLGDDDVAGPVAPFTPPSFPALDVPDPPSRTAGGGTRTGGGATAATTRATPTPTPSDTRTAYERGECLHGTISTGGEQEELEVVPCSSARADFRVLRVFPYSIAGRPCDAVSGTDYVYSSYFTRYGVPTYGSTYCLQEM